MLPKSCRPREKRIADLTPVTHSIAEFCAITGQSKAAVLFSITASHHQARQSPADPRTTTAHAASSAG
jgi:hypothetical protein